VFSGRQTPAVGQTPGNPPIAAVSFTPRWRWLGKNGKLVYHFLRQAAIDGNMSSLWLTKVPCFTRAVRCLGSSLRWHGEDPSFFRV